MKLFTIFKRIHEVWMPRTLQIMFDFWNCLLVEKRLTQFVLKKLWIWANVPVDFLLLECGKSWKIINNNNNKMKSIWQLLWQNSIHRFGTRHQHRVHDLSISCSEHLFQIFDNMDIRDRKAHIKHAQELKWSLGTNSVSVRHYQARYLDAGSYHFKWAKEVKL